MLTDLFGYIRRNAKNWNEYQTKKVLKEVNQIRIFLERKLAETEGVA